MVTTMGLGVIQFAANLYKFKGLWITKYYTLNLFLAIFFLIFGPVFFFLSPIIFISSDITVLQFFSLRNINDIDGGIAGFQQAFYFSFSLLISFFFSLCAGFFVTKENNFIDPKKEIYGIEILKDHSFLVMFSKTIYFFKSRNMS